MHNLFYAICVIHCYPIHLQVHPTLQLTPRAICFMPYVRMCNSLLSYTLTGSPNCPTVNTTVNTTSLAVSIYKSLWRWLPEWYHVEVSSHFNGSLAIVYNSTLKGTASFEVTSLEPDTVYDISVIPCNMAGCNESCDVHSVQASMASGNEGETICTYTYTNTHVLMICIESNDYMLQGSILVSSIVYIFSNDFVHGHLPGNVTQGALRDEGFVQVLSVIVGVAILSATALLLLITVIVSIPTLCLITRWVYTTMHSSMHYASVGVVCSPPPSLYVYTCPPFCHFRRKRRAKQKVCVRVYDL